MSQSTATLLAVLSTAGGLLPGCGDYEPMTVTMAKAICQGNKFEAAK